MRKRDRLIIETLEQFRALRSDQIAEMFFNHTKSPITNANFVLKRLRDRGYIEANTKMMQPYVYFPKPARIKQDGQKIDHFLKIVDFYLQLKRSGGPIKLFHVEPQYMEGAIRPDILVSWRDKIWFVEIQNSHYTHKVMAEKMKRYQTFYDSDDWKKIQFVKSFPRVWIISDRKYKIEVEGFKVLQSKSVSDLLKQLAPSVPKNDTKKRVGGNGEIKVRIG
ncbi:replication-relaxation family protein [Metabacillus bambusae]|uniref:Replication-relaxation family protein n=1 Tax=Metabacillus bambusae TaxID=2795218 RepID=A0ABS3NC83_9BACI|nr:replication-relaxation family protein [Metabacillus bambusae]MBO1515666.1 replication-relaxation family protein [Metabacillus bambusae]